LAGCLAEACSSTTTIEPDLVPVQQANLRAGSERILPPQSVVKGYEYEKDRYVDLDPEELKSIAPKTATEMQSRNSSGYRKLTLQRS
jgi:hypothetical protein